MPYDSLKSLPTSVKNLPEKAQKIWMKAFNSAYDYYDGDEEKSFSVAWAAVKKAGYEKSVDPNSFNVYQIAKARAWKENDEMYIEVPVSGVMEDREGDSVSRKCGDSMIKQYKSGTIPLFGDHGLDDNGRQTYSWKNIMGKYVDGKWAENNVDILAKVKLNKHNPDAVKLFDYVEEKMPVGFSIGGRRL